MLSLMWILILTVVSFVACDIGTLPEYTFLNRTKRMRNGSKVKLGQFPYHVFLRQDGILICSGALITYKHVLTAAHCICGVIDEPYENLVIQSGITTTDKAKQKRPIRSRTHSVASVTCHPDFKYGLANSWQNDVAVITLNKTVPRSYAQVPVILPIAATGDDVSANTTGWGHVQNIEALSGSMEYLPVTTLKNSECQKYYKKNKVLPTQICAFGATNTSLCKGDSGDPLVSKGVLIGIFSWTVPCDIHFPHVYTRIYDFRKFIDDTTRRSRLRTV